MIVQASSEKTGSRTSRLEEDTLRNSLEIQMIEKNIQSVTEAIENAEEKYLSGQNKDFWKVKIAELREDKIQLRKEKIMLLKKEEQLRHLIIVETKAMAGKSSSRDRSVNGWAVDGEFDTGFDSKIFEVDAAASKPSGRVADVSSSADTRPGQHSPPLSRPSPLQHETSSGHFPAPLPGDSYGCGSGSAETIPKTPPKAMRLCPPSPLDMSGRRSGGGERSMEEREQMVRQAMFDDVVRLRMERLLRDGSADGGPSWMYDGDLDILKAAAMRVQPKGALPAPEKEFNDMFAELLNE